MCMCCCCLQGVWFNAHRPCDGCWLPAAQVERTESGRPIAYVARHGHGTYPHVSSIVLVVLCLHYIIIDPSSYML